MMSLLLASWFALGSWFGLGLYGGLLLEPDWRQATAPGPVRHSDAALFLPETTLGYVSLVDPASLYHHLAQTQVWKLALAGSFQTQMQELASEIRSWLQDAEAPRLPYEELRPVFSGPMALALLDFEPEAAKDGQPLHLAFFADLEPGAEAKARALVQDQVLGGFKAQGRLRLEEAAGPRPYTRLLADGKPAGAFSVQAGRFLFVTHEPDLAALAERPARPLAQSPAFQKHKARFQAADLAAFVDLARLQMRILPALGSEHARTVRTLVRLGLGEIHSAVYFAVPEREGYVEHFELAYQADGKGLLARRLEAGAKAGLRSVHQAPAQTTFLLAFHMGPIGPLYREILQVLETERPAALDPWRRELADFRQKHGADLEKDLLDQLSGEFALAIKLPSISGSILDNPMIGLGYLSDAYVSVFLGVLDEKKADEVVRKLMASAEVNVLAEPYRDVSVGYLSSSAPLPVLPAYTVLDGLAGFHLNAGTAKACIDAKLDAKGLRKDQDWIEASAGLDADPSSGLLYLRLSEIVPLVARLGRREEERSAGSGPPDAEASRRLAAFGQAETLGKRLRGVFVRSSGAPGAVLRDSYSPLAMGAGVNLLGLASIAPVLFVPGLIEAQEPLDEAQVMAFLSQVHTAQAKYRAENTAYAASLKDLVQAGLLPAEASAGPDYEVQLDAATGGFSLSARPGRYRPGARSFFIAEDGVLRGADNGGAWGEASLPATSP
jgi:competence protein ComGC